MAPILIRQATKADAARISYLIRNNTDKVLSNPYNESQKKVWKAANTPGAIRKQLAQRTIFCAFINDKMVGTIGLDQDTLVGLYVSHTQLGKGIAKALFLHLENYAKEQGLKNLRLLSTPSGKGFYQKMGFEAIGERDTIVSGIVFPETEMNKKL
jgi:N-acetylglutamate synthase-like GNAT family acetyltransferase